MRLWGIFVLPDTHDWIVTIFYGSVKRYAQASENAPFLSEHTKKAPSNRMEPFKCWHYLSSRAVTRQVLSALVSLTSVFGMGTGGPSQQSIPTHMDGSSPSFIVKSLPASNRFILAHPVLPVNCFLPELLVTRTGFEPMLKAWEASVLTTWPTGHGAPSRTRTGDPLIKSQVLYQLS